MHGKIVENGSCGKRHSQLHQMMLLTLLFGLRPNTRISTFTEHEHSFVFFKGVIHFFHSLPLRPGLCALINCKTLEALLQPLGRGSELDAHRYIIC